MEEHGGRHSEAVGQVREDTEGLRTHLSRQEHMEAGKRKYNVEINQENGKTLEEDREL